MFNNTYELKDLWDNKSAELKNRFSRENGSRGNTLENVVSDSTFLGPILWDDMSTISDLDDINLDDFSSSILEGSFTTDNKSVANFATLVENLTDLGYTDKGLETDVRYTEEEYFNAHVKVSDSPTKLSAKPRKMKFVSVEQKNDQYWARRIKNNAAAKRSRDARKMMESQVYIRASMLETENEQLKRELNQLREENKLLRQLIDPPVSVSPLTEGSKMAATPIHAPNLIQPIFSQSHAHICSANQHGYACRCSNRLSTTCN